LAGFKFAARTLLELGKELISSDEVALYELIKNGIDAGSARIEIIAEIVLTHTSYVAALDSLDEGLPPDAVVKKVTEQLVIGTTPEQRAKFLKPLRASLGNSKRFRRALEVAYHQNNWLEVRDSGEGMTLATLNDVYLTVGTRSRREKNVKGATFLGDKGVGRLSAMRLGDRLKVTTSTASDTHENVLKINWGLFTHESDVPAEKIDIVPYRSVKKEDKASHGTTIRVSQLNADWDSRRFSEILHGKIARMVDPFEPGRGNKLLHVEHNGARLIVPSIPKKLLAAAHATCTASLRFDEHGEPVIEGEVDYRLRNRKRPIAQRGAEVFSIAQNVSKRRTKKGDAAFQNTPIRLKALQDLGPFKVEVYWYNRLVIDAVGGLTETKQQTRDQIREWAGGPMLFRHGYRILPYGEPDDDWVGLDLKAFGRSGFKLNRQQVIGRVSVTSAHTALSEQTNREGLVESDAAHALRTIVTWLLDNEMRALINDADKDEKLTKREAERVALEFRETQRLVEQTLDVISKRVGPEQKALVDRLSAQIALLSDQCENVVGKTDAMTDELQDEREKFVHLAAIGLMTEFIFHELDRAVGHTVRTLAEAQESGTKASLKSLEAQLVTLQKRISTFDDLAAERRQTKSNFDLADVVDVVLENHANQFERHGIKVDFEKPKGGLKIRAVRGMVIQILENLISNSVYWLKQEKAYRSKFKPRITIDIDPEDDALTLSDNGPGVDPRRRETIFEPFVTSKPAGQGRGLGLYISRELAQYHDWKLYLDEEKGIERPGRLSRFVLDMGGDDDPGSKRIKSDKR
jgi:signal transduction histidine kinase